MLRNNKFPDSGFVMFSFFTKNILFLNTIEKNELIAVDVIRINKATILA